MKQTLIAWTMGLVAVVSGKPCEAANPIFDAVTTRGVVIAPGEVLRLPPPVMADGLSGDQQRRAIESLPDNRHSWEALTRRTAVAPFVLHVAQPGPGRQIGKRVDLAFIIYADLDKVASDDFITGQLSTSSGETDPDNGTFFKMLSDQDLKSRGLPTPERPDDPRVIAARLTVLERVRLNATTRHVKTRTAQSVLLASMLDERFKDDAEFPNSWRPITRDDSGRRRLGPPQPFTGFGAYAKITRLAEPPGALFVEYHAAFAEPPGWFNGTNLLRSKLPIAAQEFVREFRRRLDRRP
jgi:hypothetical protein